MLRRRVTTAVVLLPPFVAAVLYLPNTWFSLLLAAVVMLAVWEWGALCGFEQVSSRAAFAVLAAVVMLLLYAFRSVAIVPVLGVAVAWWMIVTLRLLPNLQTRLDRWRPWLRAGSGIAALVPAWLSLGYLHSVPWGPKWVLLLFALVWIADSAAFFCGKLWGRRKLAPRISPGKSVEGLLGGLGAVILSAAITGWWWLDLQGLRWVFWVAVCAAAAGASVVGDLYESGLKRRAGVKDSGALLPGHGGIMDRIDSITAAAPVYTAGWQIAFVPPTGS